MRFYKDRSGLLVPDFGKRQRGFITCGPAFFGSSGAATSNYQDVILADGPINYWRLKDSTGSAFAADLGSLSEDGSYTGSCTLLQTSLLPNGQGASVLFGGGTITLPADSSRGAGPCSIEFWFNPSNVTSNNVPFECSHSFPAPAFNIGVTANSIQMGIPTIGALTPCTATINAGTSYHFIATLDGSGNYNYYVNGVAAGSFSGAATTTGGTAAGAIGSDLGSNAFSGNIQEVAVYNYVLTSTQAAAHWAAGQ